MSDKKFEELSDTELESVAGGQSKSTHVSVPPPEDVAKLKLGDNGRGNFTATDDLARVKSTNQVKKR